MSTDPEAIVVPRSDWMEIWWDEIPVDSIGQVKVVYLGDDEEQQRSFTIGTGNSMYVMEENDALANISSDDEAIQAVLEAYFAPNAEVVRFTPTDLEMKGLPYLETGDYLQLTAEDGTVVETYILAQTINGIQHLTTSITSTNGELLEVIDDE